MQELEERIQSEGTVKAGNVLKVDAFLNHQCDVRLFDRMGSAWAAHFAGKHITKILTIEAIYLPMGFSNFKIEGRSLGSALVLEFLLHYLTRPEYQLHVREEIYLDNMLDLF